MILVLIIFMSAIPSIAGAETVDSGKCGASSLTWTLDSDGTLTIQGHGAMLATTWNSNVKRNAKKVIVCDGVTSISAYGFSGLSITSAHLPDSITSIGGRVFEGCKFLTTVNIPASLTRISDLTFADCASLKTIQIPDSITYIGRWAFDGCISLNHITIPKGVESISSWAFRGCTSLEEITIPDGVTSIGDYAFHNCTNLKQVDLSNNITQLSNGLFDNCTMLTSIILPPNITRIGQWAFDGCSSLSDIYIPRSVTSIGLSAFYKCTNLKNVHFAGTKEEWDNITKGGYNQPLNNAIIHCDSAMPIQSNSTSANAPIITSAEMEFNGSTYNLFKDYVSINMASKVQASITADVNKNGCEDVHLYITQGVDTALELPIGSDKGFVVRDFLKAGKDVYLLAVDRKTGKSTSKKIHLSISNSDEKLELLDQYTAEIGTNIEFKIPENVPVFSGMEFSWELLPFPFSVEFDSEDPHKLHIVFGANIENEEVTKDGIKRKYFKDFDFKKYKEDFKKSVRKGDRTIKQVRNDYKMRNDTRLFFNGNVINSSGGKWGGDLDLTGYAEVYYTDGQFKFAEGQLCFDAEFKYTYQGQLFIWVVPVYYEIGGGVGAGIEGKLVNIDPVNFYPELEAYINAKIMAEIGAGIGVAKVATVGASGEGSLNIKNALDREYIKSWVEGSANFNIKLLGRSVVKKEFAKGEFLIFETGNPNGLLGSGGGGGGGGGGGAFSLASSSDYNTIDIDKAYENEDRSYAESPVEWTGGAGEIQLASVEKSNETLRKLADNIYTEAKPLICNIDGTKVMVMQWDNASRADVDRSMLVYSTYDETADAWTEPKAIDDDGTADFYPCFKDGWLVWQNEKTKLNDDMTLREIGELGEICVTQWNEDGFDAPMQITNNNTLDTQPCVSTESQTVSVVWTTNTESDILGITGRNSIMKSELDFYDVWGEPVVVESDLNAIISIDAGAAETALDIAYVMDEDNDLNTINDRDIRVIYRTGEELRLTNNNVIESNPVFIFKDLYYYSDGNIVCSRVDEADNWYTIFSKAKPGLTDSFSVTRNFYTDEEILLWSKAENDGSGIYASLYRNGEWSEEIQIAHMENCQLKYPNGFIDDDGLIFAAFNSGELEDNTVTKTDLYTIEVNSTYDLAITESYVDESNLKIYATVTNVGELPVDFYRVGLNYGYIVEYKEIIETLKPGESKDLEFTYDPARITDFQGRTGLTLEIPDYEDYNSDDNYVMFKVLNPDLYVEDISLNADESILYANISNIGNSDAANVSIKLRDGGIEGTTIDEDVTDIGKDETYTAVFTIDKDNMRFYDSDKQLYVTAEYEGEESSKGNNDNYVFITSPSGVADYETEILSYDKISGKNMINSVAVNNTDTELTCQLFTAVYSTSGMLKGCGMVDAAIAANDDTGVDISVPCELKSGDTIKTFMWKNQEPLCNAAEMEIE